MYQSDVDTSPRRFSRRRLPPKARREQLLEAALPCFARRGYAGTGTRDLARAAGVTEPILYRHFDGKAGLFMAVLERVPVRLLAALDAGVGEARGAGARLQALAAALPEILRTCRNELRVLNAAVLADDEPEIVAAASQCSRRVGQALADAFRGSGLRRGVHAETAGFLLLEVGLGTAMLQPMAIPEIEDERFSARAVQALLQGLVM